MQPIVDCVQACLTALLSSTFRLAKKLTKVIGNGNANNATSLLLQTRRILPVHVFPSPEYPELHAQVYDPSVLLHTAFTSQL